MEENVKADQETIDEVVKRLNNDAASPINMALAMIILIMNDIRHKSQES